MKKFILFVMITLSAFGLKAQTVEEAQPSPDKVERIKALYVAYITQQLSLTSDEAQKFWPIHALYDEEMRSINKSPLQELEKEEAVLKVKKKYASSFTKVLGAERSNKFTIHDKMFRDKIRERLREMRQQRKQRMPNDKRPGGGNRKPPPGAL